MSVKCTAYSLCHVSRPTRIVSPVLASMSGPGDWLFTTIINFWTPSGEAYACDTRNSNSLTVGSLDITNPVFRLSSVAFTSLSVDLILSSPSSCVPSVAAAFCVYFCISDSDGCSHATSANGKLKSRTMHTTIIHRFFLFAFGSSNSSTNVHFSSASDSESEFIVVVVVVVAQREVSILVCTDVVNCHEGRV